MNKFASTVFVLLLSGFPLLEAQVISPPSERNDLLSGMNSVLSNTSLESRDFSGTKSPFHEAGEIEEEVARPEDAETKPAVVRFLTNEDALRAIVNRLEVQGSLVLGSRGILQLTGGRTLEKGNTFEAKIHGNTYTVLLEDVTGTSYRLKLGDASIEKSLLQQASE